MGFGIYELCAGQGRLALCPAPGAGGAYAEDLEAIRAWKPALVLSMTESQELADLGAAGFAADLAVAGIEFVALPIRDFGAPGEDVLRQWPKVRARVVAALQRGGGVLVHCRGGCGRSGMIVLRLMVEMGETPEAALARLRAVRACAVETEAQMAWACGGVAE